MGKKGFKGGFLLPAMFWIWVFPKIGVPQHGWFIMENLIRIDDLEGKNTIFGNTHIPLFGPDGPWQVRWSPPGVPAPPPPRYRDLLMDHRWRIPLPCRGSSQFFGNEQMVGSRIHKTWVYQKRIGVVCKLLPSIYFGQVWLVKCQNFVCFSDVRGFKPRFFEMPPRKQSVTLKICFTKMFADLQFWRLQLKELFGISVVGGKPIRFHYQPIGLFERLVDFHCQLSWHYSVEETYPLLHL